MESHGAFLETVTSKLRSQEEQELAGPGKQRRVSGISGGKWQVQREENAPAVTESVGFSRNPAQGWGRGAGGGGTGPGGSHVTQDEEFQL